jgi:putative chitinase
MNFDLLKNIIPDSVLAQLPDTCQKFEINSGLRLAHFLSQCSHESNNFKSVVENLNYSATALNAIFGRYFPDNLSLKYARQPEMIGNRVYANRMGNGDEVSGDGFRFRGRGYIQLTGKNNYTGFANYIIDPEIKTNPDLVATKYPLSSAAFFFWKNSLWQICDQGFDNETITKLTKAINGGFNGLSQRIDLFHKFYNILQNL